MHMHCYHVASYTFILVFVYTCENKYTCAVKVCAYSTFLPEDRDSSTLVRALLVRAPDLLCIVRESV